MLLFPLSSLQLFILLISTFCYSKPFSTPFVSASSISKVNGHDEGSTELYEHYFDSYNKTFTDDIDPISVTLTRKLQMLHQMGTLVRHTHDCKKSKIVITLTWGYGRLNNNLIEFTHAMWMLHYLNATLLVPEWYNQMETLLNSQFLFDKFCLIRNMSDAPSNSVEYNLETEKLFYIYSLYKDSRFSQHLPSWSKDTVLEVSTYFISIYSSLFHKLRRIEVNSILWIVKNKLRGNFDYTAIHKRNLEGECSRFLKVTTSKDFKKNDIPPFDVSMHNPLCAMRYEFTSEVMRLHGRNSSAILVAWDGDGKIDDYVSVGAAFSDDYFLVYPHLKSIVHAKIVDMVLSFMASFFILQPASTFSFTINVIRSILGLESSPELLMHDLYCQNYDARDVAASRLQLPPSSQAYWVSSLTIKEALVKMHSKIDLTPTNET